MSFLVEGTVKVQATAQRNMIVLKRTDMHRGMDIDKFQKSNLFLGLRSWKYLHSPGLEDNLKSI
jgi:hypothetical protein